MTKGEESADKLHLVLQGQSRNQSGRRSLIYALPTMSAIKQTGKLESVNWDAWLSYAVHTLATTKRDSVRASCAIRQHQFVFYLASSDAFSLYRPQLAQGPDHKSDLM